uniref:Uncharacterized protein n=1 Tax=Timema tahoe TaxID=61484 RepID=A0A7R9IL79_9NEOP|nr:unnamed protein product [Timema tahoe]
MRIALESTGIPKNIPSQQTDSFRSDPTLTYPVQAEPICGPPLRKGPQVRQAGPPGSKLAHEVAPSLPSLRSIPTRPVRRATPHPQTPLVRDNHQGLRQFDDVIGKTRCWGRVAMVNDLAHGFKVTIYSCLDSSCRAAKLASFISAITSSGKPIAGIGLQGSMTLCTSSLFQGHDLILSLLVLSSRQTVAGYELSEKTQEECCNITRNDDVIQIEKLRCMFHTPP